MSVLCKKLNKLQKSIIIDASNDVFFDVLNCLMRKYTATITTYYLDSVLRHRTEMLFFHEKCPMQ